MPYEPKEPDGQNPPAPPSPPTAFSLPRFIPLLKERIWVINPFTRTFLVGWITLLDSIPDLELVTYLPEFLGGLLKFLSGNNADVRVVTQNCLDKFLNEIKRIARVKKGIAESKKSKGDGKRKREDSIESGSARMVPDDVVETGSVTAIDEEDEVSSEDDWIPGQDVQVNYKAILEILTATLDSQLGEYSFYFSGWPSKVYLTCDTEEDGLLESLRWIVSFLDICPEEVLPFTPKFWLICCRPWLAVLSPFVKLQLESTLHLWNTLFLSPTNPTRHLVNRCHEYRHLLLQSVLKARLVHEPLFPAPETLMHVVPRQQTTAGLLHQRHL